MTQFTAQAYEQIFTGLTPIQAVATTALLVTLLTVIYYQIRLLKK